MLSKRKKKAEAKANEAEKAASAQAAEQVVEQTPALDNTEKEGDKS